MLNRSKITRRFESTKASLSRTFGRAVVNDCMRFPPRETVNEILSFNRAYRRHLGVRQPVELAVLVGLPRGLRETDHLFRFGYRSGRSVRLLLRYSSAPGLKKLRETVGEEAYYSGQLPPYVPLWRFQSLD